MLGIVLTLMLIGTAPVEALALLAAPGVESASDESAKNPPGNPGTEGSEHEADGTGEKSDSESNHGGNPGESADSSQSLGTGARTGVSKGEVPVPRAAERASSSRDDESKPPWWKVFPTRSFLLIACGIALSAGAVWALLGYRGRRSRGLPRMLPNRSSGPRSSDHASGPGVGGHASRSKSAPSGDSRAGRFDSHRGGNAPFTAPLGGRESPQAQDAKLQELNDELSTLRQQVENVRRDKGRLASALQLAEENQRGLETTLEQVQKDRDQSREEGRAVQGKLSQLNETLARTKKDLTEAVSARDELLSRVTFMTTEAMPELLADIQLSVSAQRLDDHKDSEAASHVARLADLIRDLRRLESLVDPEVTKTAAGHAIGSEAKNRLFAALESLADISRRADNKLGGIFALESLPVMGEARDLSATGFRASFRQRELPAVTERILLGAQDVVGKTAQMDGPTSETLSKLLQEYLLNTAFSEFFVAEMSIGNDAPPRLKETVRVIGDAIRRLVKERFCLEPQSIHLGKPFSDSEFKRTQTYPKADFPEIGVGNIAAVSVWGYTYVASDRIFSKAEVTVVDDVT